MLVGVEPINQSGFEKEKNGRIHDVIIPVVKAAEGARITLAVENLVDLDPSTRRYMVDSFDSDAIALLIDTGHAHLARRKSDTPAVFAYLKGQG